MPELCVCLSSLQATAQMEERLLEIVTHCSPDSSLPLADGVLGFIQHQLVELVRDCLDKSQKGLVTSRYFAELQEKLEKLLHEVGKQPKYICVRQSICKMLVILFNPALNISWSWCVNWCDEMCAVGHVTQTLPDARGTHSRFVVEFASDSERYFCHRSYLCCDKMLVSIATSSPVPGHVVRQKAKPTCCTSSWTDKSVLIQWNKFCLIHTRLAVCHVVTNCFKDETLHFQT